MQRGLLRGSFAPASIYDYDELQATMILSYLRLALLVLQRSRRIISV